MKHRTATVVRKDREEIKRSLEEKNNSFSGFVAGILATFLYFLIWPLLLSCLMVAVYLFCTTGTII